jgi:hypothetical protein
LLVACLVLGALLVIVVCAWSTQVRMLGLDLLTGGGGATADARMETPRPSGSLQQAAARYDDETSVQLPSVDARPTTRRDNDEDSLSLSSSLPSPLAQAFPLTLAALPPAELFPAGFARDVLEASVTPAVDHPKVDATDVNEDGSSAWCADCPSACEHTVRAIEWHAPGHGRVAAGGAANKEEEKARLLKLRSLGQSLARFERATAHLSHEALAHLQLQQHPLYHRYSSPRTVTFLVGDLHLLNMGVFHLDDEGIIITQKHKHGRSGGAQSKSSPTTTKLVYGLNDFDAGFVGRAWYGDVVRLMASVGTHMRSAWADEKTAKKQAKTPTPFKLPSASQSGSRDAALFSHTDIEQAMRCVARSYLRAIHQFAAASGQPSAALHHMSFHLDEHSIVALEQQQVDATSLFGTSDANDELARTDVAVAAALNKDGAGTKEGEVHPLVALLRQTAKKKSRKAMLDKFAPRDAANGGKRMLDTTLKGELAPIDPEDEAQLREAWGRLVASVGLFDRQRLAPFRGANMTTTDASSLPLPPWTASAFSAEAASTDTAADAAAVLAHAKAKAAYFAPKSFARRVGAGLASTGARRFFVLVEGGRRGGRRASTTASSATSGSGHTVEDGENDEKEDDDDDDVLLDVKQEGVPEWSRFIDLPHRHRNAFHGSHGARVARAIQAFAAEGAPEVHAAFVELPSSSAAAAAAAAASIASAPATEPAAAPASPTMTTMTTDSFLVRARSPWKTSLDPSTSSLRSVRAWRRLGRSIGHALAAAHARADAHYDARLAPFHFARELAALMMPIEPAPTRMASTSASAAATSSSSSSSEPSSPSLNSSARPPSSSLAELEQLLVAQAWAEQRRNERDYLHCWQDYVKQQPELHPNKLEN